jgi:hypothetical protein
MKKRPLPGVEGPFTGKTGATLEVIVAISA